jgi:hypothetical protein
VFQPVLRILFIELALLQVLGTAIALWALSDLLTRLAAQHPAVWSGLGSPSLLRNNNPRSNLAILKWLWRRDFAALDAENSRKAARLRMLLAALALNFLVTLGLFIATGGRLAD